MVERSDERPVVRIESGQRKPTKDLMARERALSLSVEDAAGKIVEYGILMRTPGDDEALVIGLLHSEGIISNPADVADSHVLADAAFITLSASAADLPSSRHLTATAACGICGRAGAPSTMIPSAPENSDGPRVTHSSLVQMLGAMRTAQSLFDDTGGVHAVARFSPDGRMIDLSEDVGRHNAFDRIVGRALLRSQLPLADEIVLLSGRISYEMVEKAVRAGVSVLAAVGAATSLSVDVARAHGLTLVTFLTDSRCNICSAGHRIIDDQD